MNTELSRIGGLVDSDGTTHLADYTYLGGDRTAQVDFAQPGVKFTWIKQGSETPTDGGDQYTGWDRFGRAIDLRWIQNSGGTELERLQHGYDEASNRLYRKNLVASGSDKQDELYGYDGLYQLKEFQRGELNSGRTALTGTIAAEEDLTFDPTGNWNAYVVQAGGSTTLSQTRAHNEANGLTHLNGATTYTAEDLAGNMTKVPQPGSWSAAFDLKYDAWNRLVEVKDGGTTVAAYAYDGLNRRTKKVTGGDARHYYYSDRWQILEERLNSSTSADRQFVWGLRYIDDLVLRDTMGAPLGSQRLYVLQDYFQPTAVVNTSGTVLERYGYTAFGTSRVMDASFVTQTGGSSYEWETRYGAYRWDGETGLCHVRYRYLHPGLGRWVSRDPIGYEDGANLYQYAYNSPTNYVDAGGTVAGVGVLPVFSGPTAGAGAGAAAGSGVAFGGALTIWFAGWYVAGDWVFDQLGWQDALADLIARGYIVCTSSGERGIQGKDPNPWKGWRPNPNRPGWGEKQNPQTGKWKPVPRPPGPPPKNHPHW